MSDAPREDKVLSDDSQMVPDEAETDMGAVARITAVFLDPGKVAKRISQKPDWLLPFIIVVICAVIFALLSQEAMIDMANQRIQGQVESGRISDQQAETILEQQSKYMIPPVMIAQTVIGMLIILLIIAAILLFFGNIIFGGDNKFKHYWSLAMYAGLIGGLGMVVQGVLVYLSGDFSSVQLGPGIITAGNPESIIHKLFSQMTIFTIWENVVYGIGISVFTGASRGKAITVILIVFLAVTAGFGLLS